LPQFPSETLTDWLRDYVVALATATQTPVDLAAMLSLSVIAASCAKKVVVCMKEGYYEPLNIFTVTALPPGNRKTAVFAAVIRPLHNHEEFEAQRMAPEIARRATLHKIKESQLKRVQEQAAHAKSSEQQSLAEAAGTLAVELTKMDIPSPTRLIVSDCTPEKLVIILRQQHGRIAVMSAEGEVFDLMAGRYSANGAGNFEVYLKGHAGDDLQVDRVAYSGAYE
jgi:hypothetical protein